MKRLAVKSGRKVAGNPCKTTAATRVPFAENRYRKYRFERESIVLEAPESSGVYGLYSALWIFIGEADNIRARLLEHLTDENSCINRRQPLGFAFDLVSPEDRNHRQAGLIDELEPTCMEELASYSAKPSIDGPPTSGTELRTGALRNKALVPRFGST